MSWEREIRVEDGGEATARSLVRLGAPPRLSGGASCRTKGARPAPFLRVSSRSLAASNVAIAQPRCRWFICSSAGEI